MSDKEDKSLSSENVDSHTEGSSVSLVSIVDVIKQKALACYRSAIPEMPDDLNPKGASGSEKPESMPAETQGLAERVAETLNKTLEYSSGTILFV